MTPDELHRNITKAFNWPWVDFVKYPFKYPKGGGGNRKIMQFKPKDGGSAMAIQQMRNSVTKFAQGLDTTKKGTLAETGYYFRQKYSSRSGNAGREEISTINYYDKATKILTTCNMNPEQFHNRVGGDLDDDMYGAEYFFFNEYPAKALMMGETPQVRILGHYYSPTIPIHQDNFINWVSANPLSSRK